MGGTPKRPARHTDEVESLRSGWRLVVGGTCCGLRAAVFARASSEDLYFTHNAKFVKFFLLKTIEQCSIIDAL